MRPFLLAVLLMSDFCLGVERVRERWPTHPTIDQLKLDRYFPVASPDQMARQGYLAGARPGLPAFLTQDCLDWAYQEAR